MWLAGSAADIHRKVTIHRRVDLLGCALCGQPKHPGETIMKQLLNNLLSDESGQDLIEYALIAALIALVAITGLNGLASRINSEFTAVGGDL
jgi:pilus assembly protein Flp/PilA